MIDLVRDINTEMRRRKLSKSDVARITGIHRVTITNTITRRTRAQKATLYRIAAKLGLDVDKYEESLAKKVPKK